MPGPHKGQTDSISSCSAQPQQAAEPHPSTPEHPRAPSTKDGGHSEENNSQWSLQARPGTLVSQQHPPIPAELPANELRGDHTVLARGSSSLGTRSSPAEPEVRER